jgi:hypothetical protein
MRVATKFLQASSKSVMRVFGSWLLKTLTAEFLQASLDSAMEAVDTWLLWTLTVGFLQAWPYFVMRLVFNSDFGTGFIALQGPPPLQCFFQPRPLIETPLGFATTALSTWSRARPDLYPRQANSPETLQVLHVHSTSHHIFDLRLTPRILLEANIGLAARTADIIMHVTKPGKDRFQGGLLSWVVGRGQKCWRKTALLLLLSLSLLLGAALSLSVPGFPVNYLLDPCHLTLNLQSIVRHRPLKSWLASQMNSALPGQTFQATTSPAQQPQPAAFLTLWTRSSITATAITPNVRSRVSTCTHPLLHCAPTALRCSQQFPGVVALAKKHLSRLVVATCVGLAQKKFAEFLDASKKWWSSGIA